jgi:outer membrane protein TolC
MNKLLILLFCFCFSCLCAQDTLSLEGAISIALEQNYGIKIAKNDAEIAHLNNTRANAGLLPLVALNAGDNITAVNFQQKLANGTEIRRPLGIFNSFNTNIAASWTLYDGKRAWMEKDRLATLDELGIVQLNARIQETAMLVAIDWLEIARLAQVLNNTDELIVLLNERLKLATDRLNFGFGNKVDVLQAQIDINDRKKDRILTENAISNAKISLNTRLARPTETKFETSKVTDKLPDSLNTNLILKQIEEKNPSLNALVKLQTISKINAKQIKASVLPQIGLSGAYAFQRNDNTTGFSLFSMQHGPTFGINMTMPLYTGGNLKRQEEIAQVQVENTGLQIAALQQNLKQEALQLVGRSLSLRRALVLDTETLSFSREQQKIALERFRLGQSNALEVRESQLALENALFEIQQTKFGLLVTDVLIQALIGE